MPGHKILLSKMLAGFLVEHRAAGRTLLEALGELCAPGVQNASQGPHRTVDLDVLVDAAARRAAHRDPDPPLDQRAARQAYLMLFRGFKKARLGSLTLGRRGHPTRFEFDGAGRAGSGSQAFEQALAELDIPSRRSQEPLGPPGEAPTLASDCLRRDDVIARLRAKTDQIHRLGLTSLSLFGSVARDQARPDSDVDLLAKFETSVTSDSFFGAKFFLEDLLGKRIDLVTDSALRAPIREAIAPELIRVA
jgi:uncharacterized protein